MSKIQQSTKYLVRKKNTLEDSTKLGSIHSDPIKTTLKRENKIRTFLRTLKKADIINDELFKKLAPTGSRPGILYGLPKIHKTGVPLRPILLMAPLLILLSFLLFTTSYF